MRRRFLCVGFAVLLALAFLPSIAAFGDDEPDMPAPPDAAQADEPAEADPFVVPEGGPKEIVEYLKGLQAGLMKVQQDLPKERDRDSVIAYRKKVFQYMIQSAEPMWKAADKILDDKSATKAQMTIAAQAKYRALMLLSNIPGSKAADAMKDFPKQLKDLGLAGLARQVEAALLQQEVRRSLAEVPGAKPLDEIIATVKKKVVETPDRTAQSLVNMLVEGVKEIKSTDDAVALCNEFSQSLADSKAEGAAKLAKKIEGYARRMQLLGNTMDIEGTLLDGKPLDWNSYKGKVVLIQFWATWCGPCRGEIPNVKKYYDLYHDRGFDVVSISLDRSREDIDKYLATNPLPWPVVFDDSKGNEGFETPMAIRYGVTGIPMLVLIDRDGKVVSEKARGPMLGKELEKIIGPAEEKKADDNTEPEEPKEE
ncbi:MAG: TlpA family protein disulfide reductase [Pirellulales bacterium]|nr:TlpA family protein disulfide reductase [Pirellulales bacterium]